MPPAEFDVRDAPAVDFAPEALPAEEAGAVPEAAPDDAIPEDAIAGERTALGTAFTYQGRLTDGGSPATGTYDFQFILYDSDVGGSQVPGTLVLEIGDVSVSAGLFSVKIDFGAGAFGGDQRWLDVSVRPGVSVGLYTPVIPRHELTPTPNSLHSLNAQAIGGNPVSGTAPDAGDVLQWSGAQWIPVSGEVPNPLTLSGDQSGHIIRATNSSDLAGSSALEGHCTGNNFSFAVQATHENRDGVAVYASNNGFSGIGAGLAGYFTSNCPGGQGLTAFGSGIGLEGRSYGEEVSTGVLGYGFSVTLQRHMVESRRVMRATTRQAGELNAECTDSAVSGRAVRLSRLSVPLLVIGQDRAGLLVQFAPFLARQAPTLHPGIGGQAHLLHRQVEILGRFFLGAADAPGRRTDGSVA